MKILHIAPTPFFADRGCHMRILGEIKQLKDQGHNALIVTYHNGRDIKDLEIKRIVKIPWYNKLEAGGSWHKLYLDGFLLWTSCRAFRKFRPDVIHGHLHEGALIGWLVSFLNTRRRTPVIFDVQGSLSGELESYGLVRRNGFLKKLFIGIEKLICKFPDHFVCSSELNTELINSFVGKKNGRITTVSDGFDPDFFLPTADGTIREKLGIRASKKIVLYTGSLMKSKGIDYLINAIPMVLKSFDDAYFVIVGHPVQDWLSRTRELRIDDAVHFTGKVDYFELPKYLEIADVAVDPKMEVAGEGSGKIVNYMGAGLPIVCFDTTNNRNLLGKGGIFAYAGDSQDLASKIIKILENDKLARSIGEANRKRVISKFSLQAAAKKLSTIYQKELDNKANKQTFFCN